MVVVSRQGSPAMLNLSVAQSPKSICLHRSEQKGLYGKLSFHLTVVWQVGHFTDGVVIILKP